MRPVRNFAARSLRLAAVACVTGIVLSSCRTDNLAAYTQAIENKNQPAKADAYGEYRLADLEPNERPPLNSDEESFWLMIDKVEAQTKTAGNRVLDKNLVSYVSGVTCRVAGPHCKGIRSYVLRNPAFNATMYPNGMTTVWTGLLLRVRNEAQLAAVIGHEAGHFLRRHGIQRMRNVIEQSNAFVFVQFALAGAGAGSFNNILAIMLNGGIAAFSRDNEREADGYGVVLAAQAGYDPREAAKVWKQLEREREAIKDEVGPVPFFASHPPSEERAEMLTVLGEKYYSPRATDVGRDRFLAALLPMRAGFLRDELHLRKFDSFNALLDILIEDGANVAELHYFRGEMYRLRRNEGDEQRALDAYQRAKSSKGAAPTDIDRSIALVHRQLGNREQAKASLRRYLEANPRATDAAIIRQMLETQ